MFRVKICGITRIDDAIAAAEAGADAIGLNFYEKSPRCVSIGQAQQLAAAVAGRVLVVGVFVNATAEEIAEVTAEVPLDAIQLHGDERPELVEDLPRSTPVIRAVRMDDSGLLSVVDWLATADALGHPIAGVLVDAAGVTTDGQQAYGGTGRTVDWPRVEAERRRLGQTPLILAGGLTSENVAAAARQSRADAVDTASGVESSPGIKDRQSIAAFVEQALAGLKG